MKAIRWTPQQLADHRARRVKGAAEYGIVLPSTTNKFHNTKTTLDGVTYDSKGECRRHQELLMLERAGKISDLETQVPFELVPSVKYADAKRATPAMRYVADFVYMENGSKIVEDKKGHRTTEYKMKRHMMKAFLGIEIRET